jgi:hypothetical protein
VYKEFWWGNLRERNHFEDLRRDGKISKCIFKNYNKVARAGLIWFRIWTVGRLLCKPLCSIKCREFLD